MTAAETIETRLITLAPEKLRLLALNARYMRHEVFARLVDNLKADGRLTSVPFAWHLHDDESREPVYDEEGEPVYEVLSGNHRVKAAVAAGLAQIDVMVTEAYLPPDRRRAIQLSHNALVGEDDPATLKTIYEAIEDVGLRLYSGLDDAHLELLQAVTVESLSEANLDFQTLALVFLPHEIEQVQAVWETARQAIAGSKGAWLLRWAEYDAVLDALEEASLAYGIRNTATAMMLVLDVFSRHLDDLAAGYLDETGEAVQRKRQVPLSTVLGDRAIPAETAARLRKVINKLVGGQVIPSDEKWQALEHLMDAFEGEKVEEG